MTSKTAHRMKRSHSLDTHDDTEQHRPQQQSVRCAWGALRTQANELQRIVLTQEESTVLKETSSITKSTYKFNAKPFKIWANTEGDGGKLYMCVVKVEESL